MTGCSITDISEQFNENQVKFDFFSYCYFYEINISFREALKFLAIEGQIYSPTDDHYRAPRSTNPTPEPIGSGRIRPSDNIR
jgi:hypothetical protein